MCPTRSDAGIDVVVRMLIHPFLCKSGVAKVSWSYWISESAQTASITYEPSFSGPQTKGAALGPPSPQLQSTSPVDITAMLVTAPPSAVPAPAFGKALRPSRAGDSNVSSWGTMTRSAETTRRWHFRHIARETQDNWRGRTASN
jgi:hypothetical protein